MKNRRRFYYIYIKNNIYFFEYIYIIFDIDIVFFGCEDLDFEKATLTNVGITTFTVMVFFWQLKILCRTAGFHWSGDEFCGNFFFSG